VLNKPKKQTILPSPNEKIQSVVIPENFLRRAKENLSGIRFGFFALTTKQPCFIIIILYETEYITDFLKDHGETYTNRRMN